MKVSSSNKPVQTIVNRIRRGNISFTHKLQRREGVWNKFQKSLLIDSLLRGYPINPIYIISEGGRDYVIDGVQRLSTVASFLNNEFSISKNINTILIDDASYEIAGKKFRDDKIKTGKRANASENNAEKSSKTLDPIVQDVLTSSQIQVIEISDYTDEEVREMFRRLNSGKPLNTSQKMTPDMSDELSQAISNIISHPFFEKILTPAQFKSSVDLSVAMEILMLSEISDQYDFGSFRREDRLKFIEYYNDKVNQKKVDIIIRALDKLNDSFDIDVKFPKTSISMICYSAYRVLKDKKSFANLVNFINDFLEGYNTNEEYKVFCESGTSNADMVKGRLEYWRKAVRNMTTFQNEEDNPVIQEQNEDHNEEPIETGEQ